MIMWLKCGNDVVLYLRSTVQKMEEGIRRLGADHKREQLHTNDPSIMNRLNTIIFICGAIIHIAIAYRASELNNPEAKLSFTLIFYAETSICQCFRHFNRQNRKETSLQ